MEKYNPQTNIGLRHENWKVTLGLTLRHLQLYIYSKIQLHLSLFTSPCWIVISSATPNQSFSDCLRSCLLFLFQFLFPVSVVLNFAVKFWVFRSIGNGGWKNSSVELCEIDKRTNASRGDSTRRAQSTHWCPSSMVFLFSVFVFL